MNCAATGPWCSHRPWAQAMMWRSTYQQLDCNISTPFTLGSSGTREVNCPRVQHDCWFSWVSNPQPQDHQSLTPTIGPLCARPVCVKSQNRRGLRAISPREMSNSPLKLRYRGYFSSENVKIAPVNYPNCIEHSLNVYKIAPVKCETAPVK